MPEPLAGPRIDVTPVGAFNYAAWLNNVPLFRHLKIDNADGQDLAGVTVKFEAKPAFARPRDWPIDRIRAGEVYTLADPRMEIDPDFMERLNEADRGQLLFRIVRGDEELASACHELRVLARDEWGGTSTMAELLPAFVTPNEAAITGLLRDAAELLANSSQPIPLAGYQNATPPDVWRQTAALWSAIVGREIAYSNPPSSFERQGQKIRRASQILEGRLATCLDLAVLFASGLEAIGLNPLLVLQREHAFVGVWLHDQTLEQPLENECGELRKAIHAEELIVFETTLATHPGAVPFPQAQTRANEAIRESNEHKFELAVDIKRSRMAKIQPLASREDARPRAADDSSFMSGEPRVPELPPAPEFKRVESTARSSPLPQPEPMPLTPNERIENWRRKLLDLTLRNRLLNYRATLQTVPIAHVELSCLEDWLADGASLELKHHEAFAVGSDGTAGVGGTRPLGIEQERELARQTLERGAVLCALGRDELEKRLTTLRRKVANDQAEGGANTLYLAVGFLRWRGAVDDPRTFRAPLLLIPVQLTQRAARASFRLSRIDDEPRFNATLVEKLKRDLGVDLSPLVANLPIDDRGVDVPRLLEAVRNAVRELRGVEVVEETALASFSFAKYLMWKDLSERVGTLERNRVVAHLVNQPGQTFRDLPRGPLPVARELDERYRPEQIVHPLPADSSQLAAVMAAADGRDFVIVGPPGTGKSQTIANLIAQCVAFGKTVLFVAEKAAALNVVYRRLREHGLDDRCVELHSHKTGRKHFLEQLKRAWLERGSIQIDAWDEAVREVATRRDTLNGYAAELHRRAENGWTPVRALGSLSLRREVATPELAWPPTTRHSESDYNALRDAVRRLADAYTALPGAMPVPLVLKREWSMAWESELLRACDRLSTAATQLKVAHASLAKVCELPQRDDISFAKYVPLSQLASQLSRQDETLRELVSGSELESLKRSVQHRDSLLASRTDTQQKLEAATKRLAVAIASSTDDMIPSRIEAFARLADELIRPHPVTNTNAAPTSSSASPVASLFAFSNAAASPPDTWVLHERFEDLADGLAQLPSALQARDKAVAALRERGFSPTLIERIPVERLESEWSQANKAIWPLSLLQKNQLKTKLKAFMQPGGAPALEVDLPFLSEYRMASRHVAAILDLLGVPTGTRGLLEQNPHALDALMDTARRWRDLIQSAGGSPVQIHRLHTGRLSPVVEAARQFANARGNFEAIENAIADNLANLALSPGLKKLAAADFAAFKQRLESALSIRKALAALTGDAASMRLSTLLATPLETSQSAAQGYQKAMSQFSAAWKAYKEVAESTPVSDKSLAIATDAVAQADRVVRGKASLRATTEWNAALQRCEQLGLSTFAEALRSGMFAPQEAVPRFELAYARWWLPRILDERPPLRQFQRPTHERTIREFREWDSRARQAAPLRVRQQRSEELPDMESVTRGTELFALRQQILGGRSRKSIRELIESMPTAFPQLAPCLLMSPLSIAQYLPSNLPQFDVVVFDEASQITTWDAIGAIARGNQTIVVGDPNQLPPTSFFERADDSEDDDAANAEESIRDMPSILDELMSDGLPTVRLSWHYRSQHESLIAFSNRQYYESGLATFPAADNRDRGVSFAHVADGVYDRGRTRTNRREAEAIVADLVARMTACLRQPEDCRLTYGVVTFNKQQQDLIEDLLDTARSQQPELEWFFSDERFEPTVVKNLENVQGDERDVMLFSITFGFDAKGAFPVDFGALNRDGGHRRLNVAVTRARRTLAVYSSFLPDQLQAARSNARGVRDLKAFLEYAARGAAVFAHRESTVARSAKSAAGTSTGTTAGTSAGTSVGTTAGTTVATSAAAGDGLLEESIALALEARGWQVAQRVGESDFRVDLGVKHPDNPDRFLAGVECDGERYGRSTVARDRDITRGLVLENLGWHILQVWAIDWWYAPEQAVQRLDEQLHELLRRDREALAAKAREQEVAALERDKTPVVAGQSAITAITEAAAVAETPTAVETQPVAERPSVAELPAVAELTTVAELPAVAELPTVAEPHAVAELPAVSETTASEVELPKIAAAPLAGAAVGPISMDTLLAATASGIAQAPERVWYEPLELENAADSKERFDKPDYTERLREIVLSVLMSHGPIRDDVLVEKVAECHGFQRTGKNIRERILSVLPWTIATTETVGRFVWAATVPEGFIPFRHPRDDRQRRDVDEIPIQELIGLALELPALATSPDPALLLARALGVERLTGSVRERLTHAIEHSQALRRTSME